MWCKMGIYGVQWYVVYNIMGIHGFQWYVVYNGYMRIPN